MVPDQQHDHYTPTAVLVGDGPLAVMRLSEWVLQKYDRDGRPIVPDTVSGSFGSAQYPARLGLYGGMNERPNATKGMGWWVGAPVWQGPKINYSELDGTSTCILRAELTYLSRNYEIVYQEVEWQVWPQNEASRKLIPIAE